MRDELKVKELKALIKELEKIRGRHTELVSIYVPAGYNLNNIINQIHSEQSTAQNIKSKTVRKNVTSALEKILQHLKLYKQTPENGLAVFCGNVSEKEGVSDLELWSIEPPEKINVKLYRCDQVFVLGPLKEIVREKEIYGIIVLDKSEATIAFLKGKKIEILKNMDSIVPGKTKAGGWSANRFARIREGLLHDFLKKTGEIANSKFKDCKDLKGIIIGGPGPIKEEFAEGDFLDYTLKKKIIGVVNTSYTGEYGAREVVDKAEDILSEASVIREKKILDRFFSELQKDSGLAVYGFKETLKALEAGNIEMLLISDGFDWAKVEFKCKSCGKTFEKVLDKKLIDNQRCECGGELEILSEKTVTEDIIKHAELMGTEVEIISTETPRGEQLKELGGIAGILRYVN